MGRADDGADPAATAGPRGGRLRRNLLHGAVALVGAWLTGALVVSALGALAARAGADQVRDLELATGVGEVLDGDLDGRLADARDEFDTADRLLGNPVLTPFRVLPVVGRQLRSAGALAGAGARVLDAATSAMVVLRSEVGDGTPRSGGGRVDSLERLRAELRSVDQVLAAVDLGPSEALFGPLREARAEVVAKVIDARRRTADVLLIADAAQRLLEGPSRYLVLAGNNAEMRVGSAMVLSVGTVQVEDGRIRVADQFAPAGDIVLPQPVGLPPEQAALWGWSTLGSDFRSLSLSGRFPVNAEIAARMWSASGRGQVDGVLMLDVEGLASLLRVTGPVDVDGRTIEADGVVSFLTREQYGDQARDDLEANEERRDRLRVLAEAALEELGDASIDLRALLEELRDARDGRHLLAWAREPEVQRGWRAMDVHGELSARSLLVGLANFDNSKLDPYVQVTSEASARRDGTDALVDIRIEVAYSAPEGLPGYVVGLDDGDTYRGLVSVHLPEEASEVSLAGFDGRAAVGRDGRTGVVAARVDVERGGTRSGELRFRIPASALRAVRILPSARVPPVTWELGGTVRTDDFAMGWPPHVP